MFNSENPCPCCSGNNYKTCCQPFHEGAQPQNALQLMRSRYSAYVLNIPEYIISTTHPASSQYSDNKFSWKRGISQFSKGSSFNRLEVLDFKEKETLATVTFTAHITQEGGDATFTERSFFEKKNNKWLYRGGQLSEGHAPNLVTIGQLRLLPLAYYGDPILRRLADPIAEINDELKKLVEEMIETMDACDGIGLAAPQIHHSIRLFITRAPMEVEKDKYESGEAKVFINPKLSLPSEDKFAMSEGCLSIPILRGQVERPREITVEYTTLEGELVLKRFSGWEARVIMHEYDHIDGVLFIDRMDPKEREKLEPLLQNLEKRIHDGLAL